MKRGTQVDNPSSETALWPVPDRPGSGWRKSDPPLGALRRAATLLGLLFLALGVGAIGSSSSLAWTPTILVTSEVNPANGNLGIDTYDLDQAVQGNGSSLAAWEVETANVTEIRTQLIKRGGALNGPGLTAVSLPKPVTLDDWAITSLGDGYVLIWAETLAAAFNFSEISYRTISPTGVLGPKVTLDSTSVAADAGRATYQAISASSGKGRANVAWGYYSRSGLPASKCGGDFYLSTDGPCTYTQKATFARIASDGKLVDASDVLSRQFSSEFVPCYFTSPISPVTRTAPSTGAGTIVINDFCRPVGGESEWSILFSRVSAGGAVSPARFISFGLGFSSSMASDGTTFLIEGDRLYRIPAKKGLKSRLLGGALNLGSQWNLTASRILGLPRGQAILVMIAEKDSGGKLTRTVWGRPIRPNGSFGKARNLFSRTYSASGPGTPDNSFFEIELAVGPGRGAATMSITTRRSETQSQTLASRAARTYALAINRNGGKVPGSLTSLTAQSLQGSPKTEYFDVSARTAVAVSQDGTASVLALSSYYRELNSAPFTGSAEADLVSSKLFRNP